jgi:CBS domain-containing protein
VPFTLLGGLDGGVGTVLVLDDAGALAGIFSKRDLLLRVPDDAAQKGSISRSPNS